MFSDLNKNQLSLSTARLDCAQEYLGLFTHHIT